MCEATYDQCFCVICQFKIISNNKSHFACEAVKLLCLNL